MYVNFSKICSEKRIDDPIALANHIRARIKEETGCPASVGIGFVSLFYCTCSVCLGHNILLARLSTRKAKPDGVYWCRKKDSMQFVAYEKVYLPFFVYFDFKFAARKYSRCWISYNEQIKGALRCDGALR